MRRLALPTLYRFSAGARVRLRCPLSARDSGCATSDRVARGHIRRYFISGRSPKNITLINSTLIGAHHITSYMCILGYVNYTKVDCDVRREAHTRTAQYIRSAHQDNTWATHARAKQSPARADTIVQCPARPHPAARVPLGGAACTAWIPITPTPTGTHTKHHERKARATAVHGRQHGNRRSKTRTS